MWNILALALAAVAANPTVYRGSAGELDVSVPRLDEPEIRIDGILDEQAWRAAARLTDFTQYEPVEDVPADDRTEVLVFYTSDAIYFGIRAEDPEPHLVTARLVERDRSAFTDDWIRLMLDTFDDQRQAYVFYVNPLGIQTDGLWIEGLERRGSSVSIDFNPDFIWESDGRVTEDGWVAEIRIPYVSLRFRPVDSQSWGFNVAREIKRKGFKQSWAPLTREISNVLAQEGRFVDLRELRPRRLREVNPVVTGSRTGVRDDDGVFNREEFDPEFGVNGRLGITQNLVLDATYNPDFSHVEADAFQMSVNERFALFFPEKRPFFLEGTEVFRTPKRLVYTRQVLDPVGGAKLTGKIGSFNLGYLGAVDEGPLKLEETDHKVLFNFFRLRRDLGNAGSTFGVLATDRSELGGSHYNRVLSGDMRLLFKERYTLTAQYAGSSTDDLGDGKLRSLLSTQLDRSGYNFSWQFKFEDIHPEFRTESGFLRRTGDAQVFSAGRFMFYGEPGALLERSSLELRYDSYYGHDEFWGGSSAYEWEVEAHPSLSFRGDRNLSFVIRNGYYRFQPEIYSEYQVETSDGGLESFSVPDPLKNMYAFAIMPRIRINNPMQLNGRVYFREVPIYVEASQGFEFLVEPVISFRPTSSLLLDFSHLYSRINRQHNDTIFSTTNITRLKLKYQFSKPLLTRAIVQYNLSDRDTLRDPASGQPLVIEGERYDAVAEGTVEGQFLLSYEPSPGTIFYVGYSFFREGPHTYDPTQMTPMADGLFVKFSYLFRF
jgi:hypothetical protein